jgi:hypothetical protein
MHMEGGDLKFFAKIPWGRGQGFQEKLPGGFPYFGSYCIFKIKCFEICMGGGGGGGEESYTYHPPSPLVCRPLNFRPPSIK